MAIQIEKEFDVPQPPEEVWAFLIDPGRIVDCLPGATLLDAIDDRTYKGEIGLRLGPIGMSFFGTIHFDEVDREKLRVAMSGEGKDKSGTGSVRMTMESELTPIEGGTRVWVLQSVNLSGRLASFGRGGVIQHVADFMFGRFTGCVKAKLMEAGSERGASDSGSR